jgi:glutamate transport system substrate-binding protein
VFSTYTITTDRAKVVDFAGPYFMSGLAIAVKADNNSIHSVSDLAGKKVIVQTGTPSTVEVPKRAAGASLIPFATTPKGVKPFEQDRGDACIQDVDLLASMSTVDHNFKVVGAPSTQEPYGIGLKHGDDAMKKFVNYWLTQIYKSGLWAKVYKSTIGSVGETPVPPTPVIGSVLGIRTWCSRGFYLRKRQWARRIRTDNLRTPRERATMTWN